MSKWKCEICNSEFDNFQAQGFGGDIYCPLCYFKELYRRTKLEIDRLNNIISELEKWFNECIDNRIIAREHGYNTISDTFFEIFLDKLKALKENK